MAWPYHRRTLARSFERGSSVVRETYRRPFGQRRAAQVAGILISAERICFSDSLERHALFFSPTARVVGLSGRWR